MIRTTKLAGILLLSTALVAAFLIARTSFNFESSAEAAGGKVKSLTGVAPERYAYYPGTEELGKDAIRVCGWLGLLTLGLLWPVAFI